MMESGSDTTDKRMKVFKICDENRDCKFSVVVTSFDDLLSAVERRFPSFDRHSDRVVVEVDNDDRLRTLPDNAVLQIIMSQMDPASESKRCSQSIVSRNGEEEEAGTSKDNNDNSDEAVTNEQEHAGNEYGTIGGEDEREYGGYGRECDTNYDDCAVVKITGGGEAGQECDANTDDDAVKIGQRNYANSSDDEFEIVDVAAEPKRFQLLDLSGDGSEADSSSVTSEHSTVESEGDMIAGFVTLATQTSSMSRGDNVTVPSDNFDVSEAHSEVSNAREEDCVTSWDHPTSSKNKDTSLPDISTASSQIGRASSTTSLFDSQINMPENLFQFIDSQPTETDTASLISSFESSKTEMSSGSSEANEEDVDYVKVLAVPTHFKLIDLIGDECDAESNSGSFQMPTEITHQSFDSEDQEITDRVSNPENDKAEMTTPITMTEYSETGNGQGNTAEDHEASTSSEIAESGDQKAEDVSHIPKDSSSDEFNIFVEAGITSHISDGNKSPDQKPFNIFVEAEATSHISGEDSSPDEIPFNIYAEAGKTYHISEENNGTGEQPFNVFVEAGTTSHISDGNSISNEQPFNIFVKVVFCGDSGEHTFALSVLASDTIAVIKEKLHADRWARPEYQVLLYRGAELCNAMTVADYDMLRGGTVRLVMTGGRCFSRAPFKIHVRTLSGMNASLWVRSTDTVGALRWRLQKLDRFVRRLGVRFALHYNEKRCQDERLMVDYDVLPGDTLHMRWEQPLG